MVKFASGFVALRVIGAESSVLAVEAEFTLVTVLVLFFFSSKRRHTRCSRDWSSDVCSSDLGVAANRARHALVVAAKIDVIRRLRRRRTKNRRQVSFVRRQRRLNGIESRAAKIGRASCRERV